MRNFSRSKKKKIFYNECGCEFDGQLHLAFAGGMSALCTGSARVFRKARKAVSPHLGYDGILSQSLAARRGEQHSRRMALPRESLRGGYGAQFFPRAIFLRFQAPVRRRFVYRTRGQVADGFDDRSAEYGRSLLRSVFKKRPEGDGKRRTFHADGRKHERSGLRMAARPFPFRRHALSRMDEGMDDSRK